MAKIQIIELNYSNQLIKNYQRLAQLPGFVLLESIDKTRGRYDILSAFPYQELKLDSDSRNFCDFFSDLEQRLSPIESPHDLPFQGGAIGYFSYDLAAKLVGIHSQPLPNLEQFPLAHLNFYDWAIISDHHHKKISLVSANVKEQTQAIIREIISCWDQEIKSEDFEIISPFCPLISKIEYQKAFQKIHEDLGEGRSYQVNFSQPFQAHYRGDAWEIYKKIRSVNPVPYAAFLRFLKADILSFSPERFLLMNQQKLLTSPIKGTARRVANSFDDQNIANSLLNSSKNRAENLMIVDLMRNDLAKIAKTGSVKVEALCSLESYEAVHHLVSHIEAIAEEELSLTQIFQSCFPGGSITGAPKLETMKIIAEQEAWARGVYCGSIGYFSNHGRFDFNIAIRTMVACEEILHLAAGGGIVVDSHWEEEYEECFSKISAIMNGLN